ncbi:tail length tape measure protein [Roseobacter phage RD-1410W1-01]|uniref:Tape measure protein n=1 Tax=Roseobacter phage RD-1410W1-01 TaxID=1815984 RepID=A0A191VYL8_9CAUD|nr:tail length tape measure protein [Roseobacter phage RD-1410W1-01]ANJ20805.1 hypothetical protein RDp01_gp71 [Roseobacter phage RD-1410W1-01]
MAKFTREQLDNMSDDEFMALNPDSIEVTDDGETDYATTADQLDPNHEETNEDSSTEETTEETHAESDDTDDTDDSVGTDGGTDSGDTDDTSEEAEDTASEEEDPEGKTDQTLNGGEEVSEEDAEKAGSEEETDQTKDGETAETDDKKPEAKKGSGKIVVPDGVTQEQVTSALGFYQKITAPFKADGKDFSVRNPEDAIRLMQQGVNYSRRMQELKPMKQLNRMLQDHGLNTPDKLNFLIDLSKGDKGAIEKLLKDNKIDTMDLDTEKETRYQGNNYAGNSQDNEFRDALETTMQSAEGQQLVGEIHKSWDPKSKARLKEDPSILGNLTEMKSSGVYDKVVAEVEYQKSVGYLTDVPFLQAFDQVGEAMAKAGVFNVQEQPAANGSQMAPLNSAPAQKEPVASGARKAPAAKKPKPNPHLSSTPPSQQSAPSTEEIDYDNLSDEEFAKLAPPK